VIAGPTPTWRTVLLDLDRTLVDVESQVDYCSALAELERAGFRHPAGLGPATSWGNCTRQVVDLLVGLSDESEWLRAERFVMPHELAGAHRAAAMPGLAELLAALATRPVGIVTLLSGPATEVVLDRHALAVDAVVPRRHDIPAKPRPEQLLAALHTIGSPPAEAVMIGDSERDEMAADAAGVDFVGVTNGRDGHRFTGPLVVRDLREAAALLRP